MALAGAADTMYICWKGKQPPLEKCWQGLKGSQSITNRLIKDVPVMAPGKLPRVEAATRQSILVESIVAAPVEARDSETEGEEEDNKATRKYKKRNRKMRRTATDTSRVLLFANVPAPQFIHALVKTLKVAWVFNGTPEAGVGVAAAIEAGVQTLALCKNQAHRETLSVLVREQLQGKLVDGASELCNEGFAARLAEAESSSSETSSEEEGESDSDADKTKKKASEDEKEKKKKAKKEDKKEKEKAPEKAPELPDKTKKVGGGRRKKKKEEEEEDPPKKKKKVEKAKTSSADVVAMLSPAPKKAKKKDGKEGDGKEGEAAP